MIEHISTWAKSIILAIIIVSILEMLLPNNKTKKYIKMIMGIFILYNIISPLIRNKESISFSEIDISQYTSNVKTSTNTIEVNQESMDKRLQELYIEEIEKDITKKLKEHGFKVKSCKVQAQITGSEKDTGISKIVLKVEKIEIPEKKQEEDNIEGKIVSQIQKIKKIDTNISKENKETTSKIENADIQNIKQFLIKEYGVNEKCLKIN